MTDLFSAIGWDIDASKKTKAKKNKTIVEKKVEIAITTKDSTKEKKGFSTLGSLLQKYQVKEPNKHLNTEFQSFGFKLAVELSDLKHKSLYIKMAKEYNRALIERALSFVKDANVDNKAKLFMWKLKKLRDEYKLKNQENIEERKNAKI